MDLKIVHAYFFQMLSILKVKRWQVYLVMALSLESSFYVPVLS